MQEDLGERIVFIADDSAVARNQVKRALEPLGVQTELAKNGKEALIRLKEISEDYVQLGKLCGFTILCSSKNAAIILQCDVKLYFLNI